MSTVANVRPRYQITSGDVVTLKAYAASGDTRYLALKSLCDAHINVAGDLSNVYPPFGDDFALMYQLTGNSSYAKAAVAVTSGSLHVSDIAVDSFLSCKTVMPQVAAVYDWCYDYVVANGFQTMYVSGMTAQANAIWPETDPTRSTGWAVNSPDNNYYYGLLNSWHYGIVLFYDTAAASGWINNALWTKYTNVVLPFLTSTDYTNSTSGGYWQEGTSYGAGSSEYLFKSLFAHAVATGDNLFTSGSTFANDSILNQIYVTAPNLTENYPGGAQAGAANLLRTAQKTLIQTPQAYINRQTAGYAKHFLNTASFSADSTHQSLREDFMFYRPEVPDVDYTQFLPLDYYSPGVGLVTCRSDWTTNAIQLWFVSGPQNSLGNHQTNASNGFQIWRNYWLAASTQINHSTDGALASDNNSVTVGGNEQYYGSNSSRINYHRATSGYAYYSGEAGPAYQKPGSTTWLNGFRRDIIYIKPNIFVICDRLDAPDKTLVKKFHVNGLQSTPPPINGSSYTVTGFVTQSQLFGTNLLPASSTITTTNTYSGVYRVDVAAPTGNTVDYGLNVLEAAPSSQGSATAVTNLSTNATGVQGVQFVSGSITHVPVFEMRPGPASNFTFNITGNGTKNFYVATAHPSTVYNWSLTPTSGAATTTGSVTADTQGLLTWSVSTSGAIAVAMTTAQPPPPFSVYQPAGTLVSSAAAASTVTLSGDHFSTSSGTVTVGTSGMTLSSWSDTAIVGTLPNQISYPHTDNITVAWNTSVSAASGMHATQSSHQFAFATNPASLTPTAAQSFSWAGWVYLDSKTSESAFFSKFTSAGGQKGYVLTYDQAADRFQFYCSSDGASTAAALANALGSPSLATWYFIACGFDSPSSKSWISVNNGASGTANVGSATVKATTADFYVGSYNANTTSWFDGRVDNLGGWFNKSFTAAEITSLYNGGVGVNYSDVLLLPTLSGATAFWQFDDAGGAGAIWTDKVGNVPLTGGTSSAGTTSIGGKVAFSSSTSHSDTYSSFITTTPAGPSSGSLHISNVQQPSGTVVTQAAALTTVVVSGSLLGSSSGSVSFGVIPATVTSWTTGAITCIVPLQGVYPANIALRVTGSNSQTDSISFTVTSPPATITNVQQPLSTVVTQAIVGTTVDIIGTYFGGSAGSVSFGGVSGNVANWADTDLTVVVPNQASYPSTGIILVTTTDSRTASQLNFVTRAAASTITDVEQPFGTSCTSGLAGTTLHIIGNNFGAVAGTVKFFGYSAVIQSWSDTHVVVTVPRMPNYPANNLRIDLTTS